MNKSILLHLISLLILQNANAYNFSAVAPSGQTLYYGLSNDGTVYVTCQNPHRIPKYSEGQEPTGDLVIPSLVFYNGLNWTVSKIGDDAFNGCSGLTSVILPSTITRIESYAFYNCIGLNKITVQRPIPPGCVSSSSLSGVNSNAQLVVPCGSISVFSSSSYWSRFNNITEYVLNPAYTLTLESANTARGSVDMDCSNQDSILVVATPSYGYHFDHWNDGNVDNPRVLTSLESDSTLTAYFANNTYAITTENRNISSNGYGFNSDFQNILMDNVWTLQNGNYTNRWVIGDVGGTRCLFISSNGTSNTYNTSYGSATFAYTIVSLTAGALTYSYDWRCNGESGYDYLRVALVPDNIALNASAWGNSLPSGAIALDGGTQLRGQSTWQTKTGTANITSTGTYKLVFFWRNDGSAGNNPPAAIDNILLENGNPNPTEEVCGTVQGGGNAQYLDTMTLTAIADHYYHFVQWQDGNTENPRQIIVTQDAVYTAFFEGDPYPVDLQVNDSTRGTVSGAGTFPYHSYTTIHATPSTGYTFVRWSDNDSNSVRQIFITGNISMTAYFEPMLFTISGDANPSEYGFVIGGGIASYLDTVTLVAAPNYGYKFTQWSDRSTENPRHVVVSSDATYIAYFEKDQFSISVSTDDPSHGIVSGGGVFDYLSNRTIRANAENGYHFSHWNDGNTDNPRMVTLVQDTSFIAHFAPNQYTITVSSADESLGIASGGGTYFYGDTITLSATATAEHYHFSRWSDYSWGNPREYVVTGDRTIVAYFAIDVHSVSVASNDIARGMVEASGTQFEYGQPCTVTATAYSGYTFHSWSNGMTDNPYTFAVLSDVELTANFIAAGEQVYTITVQSADPTMGTVSGGGQALRGGTLTIRAQGNAGYRFLRWQDGNTDSVRTVTVTGNATYTAYFSETVGIEDVAEGERMQVWVSDGRIHVRTHGREAVGGFEVYDVMGRLVAAVAAGRDACVPVPAGVYLVRVAGLPARKVVVMR